MPAPPDERAQTRRFSARLAAVLGVVLVVVVLLVVRQAHQVCLSAELSELDLTMSREAICRARWTPRRWADLAALTGVVAGVLAVVGAAVLGVRHALRPGRHRAAGRSPHA